MRKKFLLIAVIFLLLPLAGATAQSYSFQVEKLEVDAYWNADGTLALNYVWTFRNESYGHEIDFVDVGLPNGNFDSDGIMAQVNGAPAAYVSRSEYQGDGSGVAVALGSRAIRPGDRGTVQVYIPTVRNVLRVTSDGYASGVFAPSWFGSEFVNGQTDMTITFHLPPEVQPEEPRWFEAPSGFPAEPETGFDDQGRIFYRWRNPAASASRKYEFGASFPAGYVPAEEVLQPTFAERVGIPAEDLIMFTLCCGFIGFMGFVVFASVRSASRRKLQYLPPKIKIEGHGIKRGLTAIEAAILMEQPMDKILTMILFAVVKKGAARVTRRDPLEIEVVKDRPEGAKGLQPYENKFLDAFQERGAKRRRELQVMMIDLVKSVQNKMKGFSRKETLAYYKNIVERAWGLVEAAETPEVKSQKYDEVMEWTMLDREYDDRTRRTFRTGPVFVPVWWGHYDPTFRPAGGTTRPVSTAPSIPGGGGGGISLPHLPGSDFAASMVNSVQTFSGNVIGNLTDFTSGITERTNPPPPPSTSTSRGGGSRSGGGCACACACAGCACACAGGGR